MKILQVLPELNSGGVERGTLEVARHLVAGGHESVVVSNGGRLVRQLEEEGSRHITMPVHRKAIASLVQVRTMRRLIERERPNIIHYRSRVPGWITWLAWRGMAPAMRPRLVSTVHGFYSVNAYSAVMTRGERVIAVSESVGHYIRKNYPKTPHDIIRVIHRGVDTKTHFPGYQPAPDWLKRWKIERPELDGRIVLLMPGRLTRWKGQEDFFKLIQELLRAGLPVHGLVAGEAHPGKLDYRDELLGLAHTLGIANRVTMLGHRGDLNDVMALSDLVFSLSHDPEAFGRVSLEAMALGKPVIAYAHGGVGEQMDAIFPEGAIPPGDLDAAIRMASRVIAENPKPGSVADFSLDKMLQSTEHVYREILAEVKAKP